MENALQNGQIPESQYAKKRSRPIEAVLLKQLYYDYLRITKTPGVVISNDAQGCFDRVSLAVGAILFRRLGVPNRAIRSLFSTLAQMKHYVRTAHGDSNIYYTSTNERPLEGGGQGNGAAGPMWIAISIVLLNIIVTVPNNATLIFSITLTTLTLLAIMYVDDTDILLTAKISETLEDVKTNAQTIITEWCNMLWVSRGCLRPEKCWWYAINFKWRKEGTWQYCTLSESKGTLLIPDHEKVNQHVAQKEPTAWKVLAYILRRTGTMSINLMRSMPRSKSGQQI